MIKTFEEYVNDLSTSEMVSEGFFRDILHWGKTGEDIFKTVRTLFREYCRTIEPNIGCSLFSDKKGIFVILSNKQVKEKSGFLESKIAEHVKPSEKEQDKKREIWRYYYITGNYETRNSDKDYDELKENTAHAYFYKYMAKALQNDKLLKEIQKKKEEEQRKAWEKADEKLAKERKRAEQEEWEKWHDVKPIHGGDDTFGTGHSSWDDMNR